MVRRWSYINTLNADSYSKYFKKRARIRLFRKSVNLKRFTHGVTKFKRRAYLKIKHVSINITRTHVFRYWVTDFMFAKHIIKYQYFHKIFINNFFFYDFNFYKNKNENLFYNFNFCFFSLTKKAHLHFNNSYSNLIKNSSLTFGWLNDSTISTKLAVPVYHHWSGVNYPFKSDWLCDFNFNDFFIDLFLLTLKKNVEIKKIFSLLILNQIFKF